MKQIEGIATEDTECTDKTTGILISYNNFQVKFLGLHLVIIPQYPLRTLWL